MGQRPLASRSTVQSHHRAPGTPREDETLAQHPQADETELSQDERGEYVEPMVAMEQQPRQSLPAQRRQAEAQDVDVPSAPGDPGRFSGND